MESEKEHSNVDEESLEKCLLNSNDPAQEPTDLFNCDFIDADGSENDISSLNLSSCVEELLKNLDDNDTNRDASNLSAASHDSEESENNELCKSDSENHCELSKNFTKECTVSENKILPDHKTLNSKLQNKIIKINDALREGNIGFLKEAACSEGGLITDSIREKAWPMLLDITIMDSDFKPSRKEIEQHPYYNQVVLDVNRSLKRFPPSIHETKRLKMLDQLIFLIVRILSKYPEMHYYQGYHDVCVTFLLVLGEETAYNVLEKLSCTHFSLFMEKTMEPTIHLLEHMYFIISKIDPELSAFLSRSEVGIAYCLSWLITWFSHVLTDYETVVRLFDFFIVSHPWMPMYLTTAVVLHRRTEILQQDCDMASVHQLLSHIPVELPFENLIEKSKCLFDYYDPVFLTKERPFVPSKKLRPYKHNFMQIIMRGLKYMLKPKISFTFIAVAVVVSAVAYQSYKDRL